MKKLMLLLFVAVLGITANAQEKLNVFLSVGESIEKSELPEGYVKSLTNDNGTRYEKGDFYIFVYVLNGIVKKVSTNDVEVSPLKGYEIKDRNVIWNANHLVYIDKDRFNNNRYIFYPKSKLNGK